MKGLLITLLSLASPFLSIFSQNFENSSVTISKLEFNTPLSEISCSYSNGELYYFQNKKAIKQYSQYYDLFSLDSSYLNRNNGNNEKTSLTEQLTIRNNYHEGPCFIDTKNKKIYITVNILDKKEMKIERRQNILNANRLRILEGDFENGIISNLKEFKYNSPFYNVGHATYSHATKRLYFSSTMPETQGGSDIFYCAQKEDGSWDSPVQLKTNVNSEGDELFPQIKNGILFFSSNSQKNQQGNDLDIFYINESKLSSSFPVELTPINSDKDDFAICFNDKSSKIEGYLTSNRNNKFSDNDDIYFFSLNEVAYEKTYDLVVSFNENGKIIETGKATLYNLNGDSLALMNIQSATELMFPALEHGEKYQIKFENKEFSRLFDLPINQYSDVVIETFEINKDAVFKDTLLVSKVNSLANKLDSNEKIIAQVDSIPVEVKKEIDSTLIIKDEGIKASVKATNKIKETQKEVSTEVLKFDKKESFENIYFAFDSYVIYEYSQDKLDDLIAYATKNNVRYVVIEAHTDARGTDSYNEKLSIKRALACRQYLLDHGISEGQIKYTGFGEEKLVNKCANGVNCPDSKHRLNRRIEFTLIY